MSSSEADPGINEDCDDPVKSGDEKRPSDTECYMTTMGYCNVKWPVGNTEKNRYTILNGDGKVAPFGDLLLASTNFTEADFSRCPRPARQPLRMCRDCRMMFVKLQNLHNSIGVFRMRVPSFSSVPSMSTGSGAGVAPPPRPPSAASATPRSRSNLVTARLPPTGVKVTCWDKSGKEISRVISDHQWASVIKLVLVISSCHHRYLDS